MTEKHRFVFKAKKTVSIYNVVERNRILASVNKKNFDHLFLLRIYTFNLKKQTEEKY